MFESRGAASDAIVPGLEQSGLAQHQSFKKMHVTCSYQDSTDSVEISENFGTH